MSKRNLQSVAEIDGNSTDHKAHAKLARRLAALRVECPGEGAVIALPDYTLHIAAAPGAEMVEVCIDGGAWLPCRESLGLWWYDWSGYAQGDHEVLARANMGDGISVISSPRLFSVK